MGVTGHLKKIAKSVVERFPSVAMAYRHTRDSFQIYKEPKETSMGFRFAGNDGMREGVFEPEETKIVTTLLRKIDIFVNIGANIGYYCCHALHRGKYVVAFEPLQSNLCYLYRNIQANHWGDHIEIFPLALSNKVGLIEIYGSGTGASLIKGWAGIPDHYVTLIPVSTLDRVLGSRYHDRKILILVDIEGAEWAMFQGATTFIARDIKPIWVVEIQISEHQPEGVIINPNLLATFKLFWRHNYEAWSIEEQPRQVTPKEVETISHTGCDTLLTHNFMFCEQGKQQEILGIE